MNVLFDIPEIALDTPTSPDSLEFVALNAWLNFKQQFLYFLPLSQGHGSLRPVIILVEKYIC